MPMAVVQLPLGRPLFLGLGANVTPSSSAMVEFALSCFSFSGFASIIECGWSSMVSSVVASIGATVRSGERRPSVVSSLLSCSVLC